MYKDYTVFIEGLNNLPFTDWGALAFIGFEQLGYKVIFFERLEQVPVSKKVLLVACIETTREYFSKFNISVPPLNIPKELNQYGLLRRAIGTMSMAEFRAKAKGYIETNDGVFIKPADRAKEFPAGVIKKYKSVNDLLYDVSDTTNVFVSSPINIVTEYRGYVSNGKLIGLNWYLGDIRKFINPIIIDQAILDYKSAPAGYSIDFGLTDKDETVLIECNDGWSLGNYGLPAEDYARLLYRRWVQIFKDVK